MITEDGFIFHIDYGFILGADPKPMTKPKMRLTDDMVAAMGGTDSKYYQEFKEISNRVYNCLRRHIGLFISMLDLLTDADPPIENKVEITRELLLREINKRFVPGETYSEAQVFLETEIENSNQTYTHAINDFFHYHAKEKTLKTAASKAFGSTFKSIKGFFS
jgi:phosphatidylinositol 3-kinase